MINKGIIKSLIAILIIVFIAAIALIIQHESFLHFIWKNEAFHSFIESIGGFIAIIMAVILFLRKDDKYEGVLFLMALGFLGMGIIDSFHAASMPGEGFVFLHSAAGIVGGFFFSMIWFPKLGKFLSKLHITIWIVVTIAIFIGIWAFIFHNAIPNMLLNGNFTNDAIIQNYIAGLLFLIASIRLTSIYIKTGDTEIMLLLILSFLFALSGFTFSYSAPWDGGWWTWHLMRLIAYMFVLSIVIQQYIKTIKDLRITIIQRKNAEKKLEEFNNDLEQIVIGRTHELNAANQQLQANEQHLRASNQQLEASNQQLEAVKSDLKKFNFTLEQTIKKRTEELRTAYNQLEQTNTNLQASELRFRSLLEKSKEAYLLIVDEKFVDCNEAAIEMLGFTKKELLTNPESISPKYQPNGKLSTHMAAEYIKQVEKNGWAQFEWTHLTKSGLPKTMVVTLTNIKIAGEATIFTSWHDITERKKSEEKVKEQLIEIKSINKKLENYSYTISHDLKEPIRSIRAFSEFISEDYADTFDDEAKDYFSRIIKASNKMALMIDDMLVLSRVGRVDIKFTDVPVSKIIKEAEDTLHHALKNKDGEISYSEMPTISCQPVWIKAVFQNLIANSINYSKKGETIIKIKYKDSQKFHEFAIIDTGKGIAEDQFEKIFGLFRKANQDKNATGSGAGLAIVTTILEQHNGKIWVEESTLGKGTTIKFTIQK